MCLQACTRSVLWMLLHENHASHGSCGVHCILLHTHLIMTMTVIWTALHTQSMVAMTSQLNQGKLLPLQAEPVPSEESTKDELSSAILQQQQQQQGVLGGDLPQQQGHPHVDLLARLKALSNSAGAQRHPEGAVTGPKPIDAVLRCMCI